MSVFDLNNKKDHTKANCFFDEPVTIARFDKQRYPIFEKLINQQLGFFWRPEEINLTKDNIDFRSLNRHEQHIFTSNLKRQILLDSVQGRAPTAAFCPIVSIPELETWIQTWAFSETIHSRSYSHIIRNVYSDPSEVFDTMLDISEIVDCAKDISGCYDKLIDMNNNRAFNELNLFNDYKEALWKCLMSVNILEGIRFYVSFAASWNYAELKRMQGNANIIKLIARDEGVHLAGTQHLLKILPQEDKSYVDIKTKLKDESIEMFRSAAQQEKKWAEYLFKDGSMIGLNYELLCQYVEWITNKRMAAVGLPLLYKISSSASSNPLPWTQKWIGGSDIQVANQEDSTISYIVGGIKNDVTPETFRGFQL